MQQTLSLIPTTDIITCAFCLSTASHVFAHRPMYGELLAVCGKHVKEAHDDG